MAEEMVGVCPYCGRPFRLEPRSGGEGWAFCGEVCVNPAAIPTGARLQADQATMKFVDGNMKELTREEYQKLHGFDPLPVWKAIEKWREEQIQKWKA